MSVAVSRPVIPLDGRGKDGTSMARSDKDPTLLSLPYMVRWFSPTLLVNAAVRAIVSPVFGTFADARAAQANVDGFRQADLERVAKRYDLSNGAVSDDTGAVWVDYLADTGDGFDSTYTMASLIAQEKLVVSRSGWKEKHELPAGRVLIFGGDQVYPYPSREEYRQRFAMPFQMAFSDLSLPRQTFVIPGNHDWYDGLNSFDYLFCFARYKQDQVVDGLPVSDGGSIGSLHLSQHRSYFSVRLPNNWWIWGCDIQFSDNLDAGQVRYFQAVAERMADWRPGEPEHKVILCVAAPGWQYEEISARAANSNIRMIASLIEDAGATVCAVLSGDTHHYCRYYSKALGLNLVTAGGGGSFLHPTHQLYNDIVYRWQGEDHKFDLYCRQAVESGGASVEQAVYPSKMQSFWLTWGNLLFPFWNYTFATLLGTLYWLMTWMYSQTPVERVGCQIGGFPQLRPLVEDVLVYNTKTCGLQGTGWHQQLADLVSVSLRAGIYQFLLGIMGLVLLSCLIRYADARSKWKKVLMGTLHWLVHLSAMVGLYMLVNYYGIWEWKWFRETSASLLTPLLGPSADIVRTIAYMVQMIFGGGIVAGFVWGIYLFITCAFFSRHSNDAFSSLRNPDFKNFLRMKLERDRLTIYPIGLWRTPTRLEWRQGRDKNAGKYVPLVPFAPGLLDGPVVIDVANVRKKKRPEAGQPGGERGPGTTRQVETA